MRQSGQQFSMRVAMFSPLLGMESFDNCAKKLDSSPLEELALKKFC